MPADADFFSVLRVSLGVAGVALLLSLAVLLFFWRGFFREKANPTEGEERAGERHHIRTLGLLVLVVAAASCVILWLAYA